MDNSLFSIVVKEYTLIQIIYRFVCMKTYIVRVTLASLYFLHKYTGVLGILHMKFI